MKILARLFVLLPLLWVEWAWAVDCPQEDYVLTTQAEVDALGATQCNTVRGRLRLGGYSGDITNLDALTHLTNVNGDLDLFESSSLNDIDGLANIVAVSGTLTIGRVSALSDVDSLTNLATVGRLNIWSNSALTNIDGLINVSSVGGELRIESNDSLTNLDGLANISTIPGGLVISDNRLLADITALVNVRNVGVGINISSNDALTDLTALSNVSSLGIGIGITLIGNPMLSDISGLTGLAIGALDYLHISRNDSLADLTALVGVDTINDFLMVERNLILQDCRGIAPVLGYPRGEPDDKVEGSITITRNRSGCNSVAEILSSVAGPTQPDITEATASSNNISLAFTSSRTTDTLFPITGYSASCTGSDMDVSGSPATDLLDNTPITSTLAVVGYDPTSVLSSIEVDIDITHSDPSDLYITLTTPEGTELILWNQGSSGGEDLVGTFPTTLTPVDSLNSVTRQTMDGDWVLSIEDIDVGPLVREGVLNSWGLRITEELVRNGSSSPIEVFGATRGRDYTCTVAPVTKLGTTPISDPYTVTVPLELPTVPTITSTDYEDGKIILTVSISDNGGTDITGYEANCTAGTNTFTGTSTSSPITVSGLTNDVAYTCTVTATNSVGTSSASAATAPITPEESTDSLPIWLLYQATQ